MPGPPRVGDTAKARERAIKAGDADALVKLDAAEGFEHFDLTQVPSKKNESLRSWLRRAVTTATIRDKLTGRAPPIIVRRVTATGKPRAAATRRSRRPRAPPSDDDSGKPRPSARLDDCPASPSGAPTYFHQEEEDVVSRQDQQPTTPSDGGLIHPLVMLDACLPGGLPGFWDAIAREAESRWYT